jgi:hypothetical protein
VAESEVDDILGMFIIDDFDSEEMLTCFRVAGWR